MSSEEVATVLDSIADGVLTVDRDFIITSFNRAAQALHAHLPITPSA